MKKVEIRPLPKKFLNGNEQLNLFKGRVLRVAIDKRTRKYMTGLTPAEASKLGKELGFDLSDTYVPGKAHPFWDSRLGTIKLGNYTTILDLDNPLDYIRYKVAINHKWVAPSLEAYNKGGYADALFYVIDHNKEDEEKSKELKIKQRAFEILKELDAEQKRQMALLLNDKLPSQFNKAKVDAVINDVIETDPKRFIEMYDKDDKYKEVRAFVIEAIGKKVITKKSGKYMFASEILGVTKEEVVANLLKPEFDKLYAMIAEKVSAKK